jgi:hypothetical protein
VKNVMTISTRKKVSTNISTPLVGTPSHWGIFQKKANEKGTEINVYPRHSPESSAINIACVRERASACKRA